MGGLRLFVIIGIPIIAAALIISAAMYFCFPEAFKETFPCVKQLKPQDKVVKVPVIVSDADIDTPPGYNISEV